MRFDELARQREAQPERGTTLASFATAAEPIECPPLLL
jgi:hypothetical protein